MFELMELMSGLFYEIVKFTSADFMIKIPIFMASLVFIGLSAGMFLGGKVSKSYRMLKMSLGVLGNLFGVFMLSMLFLNFLIVDRINTSEDDLSKKHSEFFNTSEEYMMVLDAWPTVYYAFEDGELSYDEINAFEEVDRVIGKNSYSMLKETENVNKDVNGSDEFTRTEAYDLYVKDVQNYLEGDTYAYLKEANEEYMFDEIRRTYEGDVLTDYGKKVLNLVTSMIDQDVANVTKDYRIPYGFYDCNGEYCYISSEDRKIIGDLVDVYENRFTEVEVSTVVQNKLVLVGRWVLEDSLDGGSIDDLEKELFEKYDDVYGTDIMDTVVEFEENNGSKVVEKKLNVMISEMKFDWM